MTKKLLRPAIIAGILSLIGWGTMWAVIARDLHDWKYSCDTDTACEIEDDIREKAERSIR